MTSLTHLQRGMLADLVQAGHGYLDLSGRVCAGPDKAPIPGDPIAWLVLVAQGYVAGERGILIPTEEGRTAAHNHGNGRVRQARG